MMQGEKGSSRISQRIIEDHGIQPGRWRDGDRRELMVRAGKEVGLLGFLVKPKNRCPVHSGTHEPEEGCGSRGWSSDL